MFVVFSSDSDEHAQASLDAPCHFVIHAHLGVGHSLHDRSHRGRARAPQRK
jgi:hypothetical protein